MIKKSMIVVILMSLLLIETDNGQAQEESPLAMLDTPVEIEAAACPIRVPDSRNVECGYLIVPADYDDPDGTKLRLPYIILNSRIGDPKPDPIIFTVGGPGYSSLDSIWGFVNSSLSVDRDIIIFEQRGNLHTQPALTCDSSFWWDAVEGHTPCLDSLKEQGIDLTDYTSTNIAADIVALREALGYEVWNLYGTSYSTTLMLLVMEMDPEGVRSAILQSVRPPHKTIFNHEADHVARSIKMLFEDCQADPDCAAAYPDLEGQFYELIRVLNREPIEVQVNDRESGGIIPVAVDGHLFIDWIMTDSFYQPSFLPGKTPYLPLMIEETANGNLGPLSAWTKEYWSGMVENEHWALGLLMAINCQEDFYQANPQLSPEDKSASEWLGGYQRNARSKEVCRAWGLPPAPPLADGPLRTDTPTLILAGSYDPVTPPGWGKTTAEALPNSTYVEFGSAGHEVTMNNPCAQQMVVEFIRNPGRKLEDGCIANQPGPSFVTPGDLYMAPGIYNSVNDVELGSPRGKAWLEAITTAALLLQLGAILGLLSGGLVWLVKRRGGARKVSASATAAYFLAFATAIIVLALPILLTNVNNHNLNIDDYVLRTFGAGRDFLPATLLAAGSPILLILIVALAAMVLWAWVRAKWSLRFRSVLTVVFLAALPMVYLGLRWDLFTMLI